MRVSSRRTSFHPDVGVTSHELRAREGARPHRRATGRDRGPAGPGARRRGPGRRQDLLPDRAHRQHIARHGIAPDRICAVTFTNKAADEIADRLRRELGPARRGRHPRHAARALLRHPAGPRRRRGPARAASASPTRSTSDGCCGGSGSGPSATGTPAHPVRPRTGCSTSRSPPATGSCSRRTARRSARRNLLDYDDLIARTGELLRSRHDVRRGRAAALGRRPGGRVPGPEPGAVRGRHRAGRAAPQLLRGGRRRAVHLLLDRRRPRPSSGASATTSASPSPIVLDVNRRCSRQIFEVARRLVTRNPSLFEKRLEADRDRSTASRRGHPSRRAGRGRVAARRPAARPGEPRARLGRLGGAVPVPIAWASGSRPGCIEAGIPVPHGAGPGAGGRRADAASVRGAPAHHPGARRSAPGRGVRRAGARRSPWSSSVRAASPGSSICVAALRAIRPRDDARGMQTPTGLAVRLSTSRTWPALAAPHETLGDLGGRDAVAAARPVPQSARRARRRADRSRRVARRRARWPTGWSRRCATTAPPSGRAGPRARARAAPPMLGAVVGDASPAAAGRAARRPATSCFARRRVRPRSCCSRRCSSSSAAGSPIRCRTTSPSTSRRPRWTPATCEIVEMAAVRVRGPASSVDQFQRLVRPSRADQPRAIGGARLSRRRCVGSADLRRGRGRGSASSSATTCWWRTTGTRSTCPCCRRR